MKKQRTAQEKFEVTRKIFNRFLTGMVCMNGLYFTLTMIEAFTDFFEQRKALMLALSIVSLFLSLFFIASTIILFVRLKKIAAAMKTDDQEKQSDGRQNEDL